MAGRRGLDESGHDRTGEFSPEETEMLARHGSLIPLLHDKAIIEKDTAFIHEFERIFMEMFPEEAALAAIVSYTRLALRYKILRLRQRVRISGSGAFMPRAVYYQTKVLARMLKDNPCLASYLEAWRKVDKDTNDDFTWAYDYIDGEEK